MMTPEQLHRETQAAEQIRDTMRQGTLGRIEAFRDYLQGSMLGRAYDSDAAKYLVGVMREGNRRLFEEGWFGRTTSDIIYERNMGTWGQHKGTAVDEPAQQMDDVWERFYGQREEQSQDQGHGQSMER